LLNSFSTLEAKYGKQGKSVIRAIRRIIKLYESLGKPDTAAEYRTLLAAVR
jgi:hypothetical protein